HAPITMARKPAPPPPPPSSIRATSKKPAKPVAPSYPNGSFGIGGALESISPIFRVHEISSWRQHIEFLWNFLRTDFQVNANTSCDTHVHLSRAGGYSLADLKQICQSIIHFEPAFEALLPEDRLSNEYARSNWLDNANFGHRNLSRKQSIAVIQRASSMRELVLLMNPDHDKMFGWNFLYNLEPRGLV
ncbi:hypothetical protein ARAM_005994, partial [Aspergillus rambellii]